MYTKQKLERIHELIGKVLSGLEGKPFAWGDGQRNAWISMLQEFNITLVTQTGLKKRGYRLKRGAKPVGSAYFGAPLQIHADLYVLQIQCVKVGELEQTESEPQPEPGSAVLGGQS
jgi:hypothetical protein